MCTTLQCVDVAELGELDKTPSRISALNNSPSVETYFFASLNYFLTGEGYPSAHPLAPALGGTRSVDTDTLECGNFTVLDAGHVQDLLQRLLKVDQTSIRAAVETADLDVLVDEQECYEFEVFSADEVPDHLMADLAKLIEFYQHVAVVGGAVVGYTT